MADKIRSPICTVVGHVDHGKSSILDFIRGSGIIHQESGGITQEIGASIIPREVIEEISGDFLKKMSFNLDIPSLLFIDTPGHEAFMNMRKRGGNLADIAVVVVDINEGFKPQTHEAVEILKEYKTPFIVAANKVDQLKGWNSSGEKDILTAINNQTSMTKRHFEEKIYSLVGSLSELGLNSERFDRVNDFGKNVGIVPTSAITGEGISELLTLVSGLSQNYLKEKLKIDPNSDARGSILEVKRVKGRGECIDVILYDGFIKNDDKIVIGSLGEPLVTNIRAIYQPKKMSEIRDKKVKMETVKDAVAATGIRISANGLEHAVAGMPIRTIREISEEEAVEEIKKETSEVIFENDEVGVVLKADSLGSLEALMNLLKKKDIPVKYTGIGSINKKDIAVAESVKQKNPLYGVILGFNVGKEKKINLNSEEVMVFMNQVIYQLIEGYEIWYDKKKVKLEKDKLEKLNPIGKFRILPGYVFRQNNPAVVGVEVISGKVKTKSRLLTKNARVVGEIKSIKNDKQENISSAKKGMKVPISIEGVTVGRQIDENDELYCDLTQENFREYKDSKKYLTESEIEVLKEISKIKRKQQPTWGI
ncbi:MAG: translation initiation factor IF-2 [Candidatus Woesearchaeota archaeon]